VAAVGAAGLGRLVVDGATGELDTLRRLAGDPRWRVREGVAMALQRIGSADMETLLGIARAWATGSRYEQRAAVAGLAEPVLLGDQRVVADALDIFDDITASTVEAEDTRSDGFVALAKALAYGWSVLVAAAPDIGKPRMERWLAIDDRHVRRIMRENLRKNRLDRMDPAWVARWRERVESSGR
jgi:HEAT repeat protein